MYKQQSLGEVVRGMTALVQLMDYIEHRSASIYIRDYLDGKLGTYALSDLPAPRALHWGFEFLKNCTIPIPLCIMPDTDNADEDADSVVQEKNL